MEKDFNEFMEKLHQQKQQDLSVHAMEAEEVNERFFKQRERNIKTDRLTTKFKESCTNMEFDIADA